MKFERLRLAHLGANSEDGVSLVDEVELHMAEIAKLCCSELHGDKGRVDISIDLERSGEEGIVVDARVKATRPRRRRKMAMAYLNTDGSLMVQKAEQLALPIKRKPRLDLEQDEESTETTGAED